MRDQSSTTGPAEEEAAEEEARYEAPDADGQAMTERYLRNQGAGFDRA